VLAELVDPDTVLPGATGVLLLIAGSVLLTLGLVRGDDWGWTTPRTSLVIAGGLVVLGVLVLHQRRSGRPAVDPSLFRSANFSWAVAASAVYGAAFSAMFLSSVLFLTDVWQYSIIRAAIVAVLAPFMGQLATRIGQRPLLVVGGLVYAATGVWRLAYFGAEPAYLTAYLPSMAISGVGVALCIPQLSSVVGQALPPTLLGVGSGVSQAARQLGATAGVALAISFLAGATSIGDALGRFDRVWWLILAGGVITSLLCVRLQTGTRDELLAQRAGVLAAPVAD
jgi:hypothetical protein